MMQTIVVVIVVAVAIVFLSRYIVLEIKNPCRGCTKQCDKSNGDCSELKR